MTLNVMKTYLVLDGAGFLLNHYLCKCHGWQHLSQALLFLGHFHNEEETQHFQLLLGTCYLEIENKVNSYVLFKTKECVVNIFSK